MGRGTEELTLPASVEEDIRRAVEILKAAGCTEVFVFGSLAAGKSEGHRDIDLAIRGCPRGRFFHLLGRLIMELRHPVDLVNLDSSDPFARFLEEEGELLKVG